MTAHAMEVQVALSVLERAWPADARRVGPVPLARLLAERAILPPVEMPGLSRGTVFDYLAEEGYPPPDLGEDEDLAGFLFVAGSVGLIFVNAGRDNPIGRRRFTVAHEFGHFLLHRDRMVSGRWHDDTAETIRDVDGEASDTMEAEANRFAASLLMPEGPCRDRVRTLRDAYGGVPDDVLVHRVAADLLVSREALSYRLRELDLLHEPAE